MDQEIEKHASVFRHHLEKLVVFTDAEWAIFKTHLQLKTISKKQYFVREGQVCREVGFIITGSARMYFVKDGEEVTNYFCFDNELISSYKSYLTQQPSACYLQALTDMVLITFSHKSMEAMLDHPVTALKMERFGRKVAEYLVCCYEDRVLSFVTQTPEERYADLLKSNSIFLQRVPQHYLANYLGITPVSLSRIRKRMIEPHK